MTSFKLVTTVKANEKIPVAKYKSSLTGLTVILAEVEGPIVNGYFALATEAHDDDGLPHTLEHLIFLGSELYPFKGVLDLIANRCLASGTNAWTDTDHTCYTMTTAGSEGFLSLLPIYLNHILYPTLTDAGYITEVHHISGDGHDGGVVYCEMQGRENTGESRVHLEMLRAIYPDSGYCAETGGIMKNLRESTSIEKVRAYHKQFYRPDNLTVIITGQVKPEELFKVLQTFEELIASKGTLPPFEQPWLSPIAPLTESKDLKVLYPSDEEDCGIVHVAYRGPLARTNHKTLTACSIILRYLSDTSVSPLQRDMVEIDDPYASKVNYSIGENSESLLYFSFENVPMEKIDKVFPKYTEIVNKIAAGEERIDMGRLQAVIDKQIQEQLSSLESNPHDDIAFHAIGYVLYGSLDSDFDERLNSNRQLVELKQKDEQYWLDLFKKYFINAKHVIVRAVPSVEEQQKMAKEELDRIEEQRKRLGEEGLQKCETVLDEAREANETQPPTEMLTQVPVPNIEAINFHPLEIFKSSDKKSPAGVDLQNFPVYTEAYDLHSNFVYSIVSLNTESVPSKLRPYLLLLLDLFTESPILRDGTLIPYEEVVVQLEADTVAVGSRLGLETSSRFTCGPYSNTISIVLQVEVPKYNRCAQWITEILNQTQFTTDRIRVTAAKMANDVAQAKRNGNSIARTLLKSIYYKPESNVQLVSLVRQQKFLNGIIEKLDSGDEGAQSVIDDLNRVRGILTSGTNVSLHIAADWEKLSKAIPDLVTPWLNIVTSSNEITVGKLVVGKLVATVGKLQVTVGKLVATPDWKLINHAGNLDDNISGVILGLGCVESAFLFHVAPCTTDFTDPDLPAMLLFLQYLTQLEGPLWRQIRGQGFAYGYSILPRPNEGLLYLSLYRATNVFAAYKETKTIVEAQLKPDAIWDPTLLESARSSLIFEIIQRERSVGDVVVQALLFSFKEVPVDYNKTLVKKINSVTLNDLQRAGEKYVAPLFSTKSRTAIVCHPDKTAEIKTAFEQ